MNFSYSSLRDKSYSFKFLCDHHLSAQILRAILVFASLTYRGATNSFSAISVSVRFCD